MVLVSLYLIEVDGHRYVGSTQNLFGRMGDHYRRSLYGGCSSLLSSVMKKSEKLDQISGQVLAVYDIPTRRTLSRDWSVVEHMDSRILGHLESYWINDLETDLNNSFKNNFSPKYLREYHEKYWVSHGGGRSICLKEAYDQMMSDYTIDSIRPELECN